MKRKTRLYLSILCLILILVATSLTSCLNATAAANTSQTFTGIVIDEHCFEKKPDPTLDSKKCLMMPACAATGYGIAVKQDDDTYKFYFFDGEFAPAASGAQKAAASLIEASSKTDNFMVSVTGTLTGEKRSAADGQTFPLIEVSSIKEIDG